MAALLGAGVGDGADIALLNDGKGFRAQATAQKKIVDILQAAGLFVQKIGAFPRTVEPPGDHDFRIIPQLFRRTAVVVLQDQPDFRHVQRGLPIGTGENDVFHGLAAQLLDTLFAHDPADGVDDVAFTAAVGTHHRRYALGEADGRFILKGFETLDFKFLKFHPSNTPTARPVVDCPTHTSLTGEITWLTAWA